MQVNKNIQRNTMNEARVKMSDIQKSGVNMSYSSQVSGGIGKLIPTSVQWIMAGDKFSGSNSISAQFEPLAVPMSGRLKVESHNFFVRMRNIYRDWDDFMVFNQGRHDVNQLPTFNIKAVMTYLESKDFPNIKHCTDDSEASTVASAIWSDMIKWMGSCTSIADHTTSDFFIEYQEALMKFIGANPASAVTTAAQCKDFQASLLQLACDKLVGEGSYLDFFGYPIFDHATINQMIIQANAEGKDYKFSELASTLRLSDAPIRAFYYVWYAYYRNIYTEPKVQCINPRQWTSTALDIAILVRLLVPRFRNWDIDMFTGAQTDDISRHVNVVTEQFNLRSEMHTMHFNDDEDNYQPVDTGDPQMRTAEGIMSQTISYIDVDGNIHKLDIPVPTIFSNAVIAGRGNLGNTGTNTVPGTPVNLPLLQLRRTQMLETYLKRCFYSGDLYQDYMKGIYGTDISDAVSNLPEYLPGGSSTPCDVSQEVNNTSTEYSPAGTKTAVMSAQATGDNFVKFADEFGLYLNVMSFLPECAYDGMPNQLLYMELMDFPIPMFSQQDDEFSHRYELKRTALESQVAASCKPFAHHPYKHDWRSRTNDFHGNALSTRKAYNFGRLFDYGSDSTTPKLNASFLHCKPNLDMFISSSPLNDVWFGYIDHKFYVERALSAYTETI